MALRPEEEWARAVMQRSLGVPVEEHDDGSLPGMHDLNIMYADEPPAAAEVTSAADPDATALWKLVNSGGRRIEPNLDGGWMAVLDLSARGRRVLAELPGILRDLESRGVSHVLSDEGRSRTADQQLAHDLGIKNLRQSGTNFRGSIYFTLEPPPARTSGVVPDDGGPLAVWLGDFLREPRRSDNLDKLDRSGSAERHMFVLVPGFAEAPFAVADLLMRDNAPLPITAPNLPSEVTHVWAASRWASGSGMRWDPAGGWSNFSNV
jgi:hypothetical protein